MLRIASTVARAAARVRGARLSILIYHRVLDHADPFNPGDPDIDLFRQQMRILKKNFRIIELEAAVRELKSGELTGCAACVTFDDGYADNLLHAAPILGEFDIPATFFIATDYLDGGLMWNDAITETVRATGARRLDLRNLKLGEYYLSSTSERTEAARTLVDKIKYLPGERRDRLVGEIADHAGAALPRDLMLTSAQLCCLSEQGFGIGAHTCSHPILSGLEDSLAQHEISEGRSVLEELLNRKISLFAYPNGKPDQDYNKQTVELVKGSGFDAAVTTAWGTAEARRTDLFQLPRFTPWDRDPYKFAARLWRNYHTS